MVTAVPVRAEPSSFWDGVRVTTGSSTTSGPLRAFEGRAVRPSPESPTGVVSCSPHTSAGLRPLTEGFGLLSSWPHAARHTTSKPSWPGLLIDRISPPGGAIQGRPWASYDRAGAAIQDPRVGRA